MSANPPFVKIFPVGPLQCNCTIIGDKITGEAIVVDPGGDAQKILKILEDEGLKVVKIIHTHAHFDHFMASGELHEATGAPLCLHSEDKPLWQHLEDQCRMYNLPFKAVPDPGQWLEHEEEMPLNGKALHTPGHTPGSMSFLFEDAKLLVAGDTLFRGSIGRTDLWGGDYPTIERSIKTVIYRLDEELTVVTGHGPSTTVGFEMMNNSFVTAN